MAKHNRKRDEDLFKESTMTFGEHLEELRACLFKGILGVALAFILVLVMGWADGVVRVIQSPLRQALERFYLNHSKKRLATELEKFKGEGIPTASYDELVDVVEKDKFFPHFYRVDVRQLVKQLQDDFGLKKKDIPLDLESASVPADFVDVKQFVREIYANHEIEGDPAQSIWTKLNDEEQGIIKSAAAGDAAPENEQTKKLASALTKRVLSDPEFYAASEAYFQRILSAGNGVWQTVLRVVDISGAAEERKRRADRLQHILDNIDKETQLPERNRQLLAVAYPAAISAGPRRGSMLALTLWQPITDDPRINPQSLNAQEMFMVWVKAALLLSVVISSPWVFYQVWSFVAAGLYGHEKRYVNIYLPFSIALFLAGAAICFFFVFKYVLDFLFLFNEWMEVDPDVRISEWFGFALFLPLGFGIAFQLPLVMLFMERIGVMTVSTYLSKWRLSVFVICVASALLTPADPYSMLLMAVPLVFLYFGGILLCKYMPKGRNPFAAEEEETP